MNIDRMLSHSTSYVAAEDPCHASRDRLVWESSQLVKHHAVYHGCFRARHSLAMARSALKDG